MVAEATQKTELSTKMLCHSMYARTSIPILGQTSLACETSKRSKFKENLENLVVDKFLDIFSFVKLWKAIESKF